MPEKLLHHLHAENLAAIQISIRRQRNTGMTTTNLTGGRYENATRIDAACWLDGNDDELIIEFWAMPGSFFRSQYNRRTTQSKVEFVPVASMEFARLQELLAGQNGQYQI